MPSFLFKKKPLSILHRNSTGPASPRLSDSQRAASPGLTDSPTAASPGLTDSPTAASPRPSYSPTTDVSVNGCQILFEGASPIAADIVFVHGLRGHPTKTWTKDDICWPRDLLPDEAALSHVRVLTFGYDADVVKFVDPASQNSIFEHSRSLVNELARAREGEDSESRPIIFVAHSLGGLVVKDALDLSDRFSSTQPLFAPIFRSARGIIFLGTPHRGSDKASWGNIITSIARIALREANESVIHDLERNSQTLDRIGLNFSLLLAKRTFQIFSFTEELPMSNMKGVGKVVENDSGIINDAYEVRNSIHANHIDMVKFGGKDDHGYQSVLFAIKKLLPTWKEPKLDMTAIFDNIPRRLVPHSVQRKQLLMRLKESFERTTKPASPLVVVLIGMGGSGKTQLALQYSFGIKESGTVRGLFWIDASSRSTIYRGMGIIAKRLFPGRELDNADDTVALVRDALSSWDEGWLMIFDNLDNPSTLKDIYSFFPNAQCGSILITSRHRGTKDLGRSIEVLGMEDAEGLELLLDSDAADEEQKIAGREILKLLGYLPLAIDQARAYIKRRDLRLTKFVEEYERRKEVILKEIPTFWYYYHDGDEGRPLNIATTWEMSLSLLGVDEDDRAKRRDVLTMFAFFHPVAISEELFITDTEDTGAWTSPMSIFMDNEQRQSRWDHLSYESAITEMQELSLLQFRRRDEDVMVVSLHSMVSQWLRMRLSQASKLEFLGRAVLHLRKHLDSNPHNDFIRRQEVLSHLNTIRDTEQFINNKDHFYRSFRTFGKFYQECGMYNYAEEMLHDALENYEEKLGPDHVSTLKTWNSLGILYKNLDRLEEAENIFRRALAGMEKTLGPNDMLTLNSVDNLGLVYRRQGRLQEAEKMHQRALVGREETLGPDHLSTLTTVDNLGVLFVRLSRLEDAEKMHLRALAGREKTLGSNHSETLNSVGNLGVLYKAQGRLDEAEKMHKRLLAGKEGALGPTHTSTLMGVTNLGMLYKRQGRLEEAERLFERAFEGYKRALGPNHASTLGAEKNLAALRTRSPRSPKQSKDLTYRRSSSLNQKVNPQAPRRYTNTE